MIQVLSSSLSCINKVDAAYFSQTHLGEASNTYFSLIGGKNVHVKVRIINDCDSAPVPSVTLEAKYGTRRKTYTLSGPIAIPSTPTNRSKFVSHYSDSSFTGNIEGRFVGPGVNISLFIDGTEMDKYYNLSVGAPNAMRVSQFDIHFFTHWTGGYTPEYTPKCLNDIWSKFPVHPTLETTYSVFPTLVIPRRRKKAPDNTVIPIPAVRVSSANEYREKTGYKFDGEQAASLEWSEALKRAAGAYIFGTTGINIFVRSTTVGGQGGAFHFVAHAGREGVYSHELGHAYGLPHWAGRQEYPYRNISLGIPPPCKDVSEIDTATPLNPTTEEQDAWNHSHASWLSGSGSGLTKQSCRGPDEHVGHVWGFDPISGDYLSPVVEANNVGGYPAGHWRNDPMQGGGSGPNQPGHCVTFFSDYSVHRMALRIEENLTVYNYSDKGYYTWDRESGAYSKPADDSLGRSAAVWEKPEKRNVKVFSLIVSVLDRYVSMVYRPVGPYTSNILPRYQMTVRGKKMAKTDLYCENKDLHGCDLSLEVMQGGEVSVYMLPINWKENADPHDSGDLKTFALNVPEENGVVQYAKLLLTPDANSSGVWEELYAIDIAEAYIQCDVINANIGRKYNLDYTGVGECANLEVPAEECKRYFKGANAPGAYRFCTHDENSDACSNLRPLLKDCFPTPSPSFDCPLIQASLEGEYDLAYQGLEGDHCDNNDIPPRTCEKYFKTSQTKGKYKFCAYTSNGCSKDGPIVEDCFPPPPPPQKCNLIQSLKGSEYDLGYQGLPGDYCDDAHISDEDECLKHFRTSSSTPGKYKFCAHTGSSCSKDGEVVKDCFASPCLKKTADKIRLYGHASGPSSTDEMQWCFELNGKDDVVDICDQYYVEPSCRPTDGTGVCTHVDYDPETYIPGTGNGGLGFCSYDPDFILPSGKRGGCRISEYCLDDSDSDQITSLPPNTPPSEDPDSLDALEIWAIIIGSIFACLLIWIMLIMSIRLKRSS